MSDGEPGLNYLCAGYKKFFEHIGPYLETIAQTLRMGYPAERVMELIKEGNL